MPNATFAVGAHGHNRWSWLGTLWAEDVGAQGDAV
jgi:hypothetical protein